MAQRKYAREAGFQRLVNLAATHVRAVGSQLAFDNARVPLDVSSSRLESNGKLGWIVDRLSRNVLSEALRGLQVPQESGAPFPVRSLC